MRRKIMRLYFRPVHLIHLFHPMYLMYPMHLMYPIHPFSPCTSFTKNCVSLRP